MTATSVDPVSVNARVMPLVQALLSDADALRIGVTNDSSGARVVDAGIDSPGGIEAGRRIALICMGGLGQIQISAVAASAGDASWPFAVNVGSTNPVLACLASQYAGWSLNHGDGSTAFRAMGSGPARALAGREPLFAELGYSDTASASCLVLEVDKPPPPEIVSKIATDCAIKPENLTIILTPTKSIAGLVQIVSRVLEVALHKVHDVGFDLRQIVDGLGSAPVPPPGGDFLTSMGRSNDAILLAGVVHLFVDTDDDSARQLAAQLPSNKSSDYGRPFADVFRDVDYDFYRIDPKLFAPARVLVSNIRSGSSFQGGQCNQALLNQSFGGPQSTDG